MRILIIGATGFIGNRILKSLIEKPLDPQQAVIALTRSSAPKTESTAVEWRSCDLFSLMQTEVAVRDADVAIYLVHSMLPAARLNQSSFEDTDLILADNFARACRKNGVKRIIYMGGLIPPTGALSAHLRSRLEVEHALAAYGAEVTTLRAGLVLGSEGSSFQILAQLVKKLPVLICPSWTRSTTQPVAVPDVIQLVRYVIQKESLEPGPYDIGGPDRLSYQELMEFTAKVLGLRRRFFSLSVFSPGLSLLWVRFITGASRNLITPLIQSLKHEMVVQNRKLLDQVPFSMTGLESALREALRGIKPTLRTSTRARAQQLKIKRDVRSIQRLPLPQGRSAAWMAQEYFRWLPRSLAPLILVTPNTRGETASVFWEFRFRFFPWPLLILKEAPERSTSDRTLLRIVGGVLVAKDSSPSARLEFREVLGGSHALAAIHDFKPRLPWPIYKFTQAVAHLWVMNRFRAHLSEKPI